MALKVLIIGVGVLALLMATAMLSWKSANEPLQMKPQKSRQQEAVKQLAQEPLLPAATESATRPSAAVNFPELYTSCQEAVRYRAKYPSSFDSSFFDMGSAQYTFDVSRGRLVKVEFSVKNAFGMQIAGIGTCVYKDGRLRAPLITMENGEQM